MALPQKKKKERKAFSRSGEVCSQPKPSQAKPSGFLGLFLEHAHARTGPSRKEKNRLPLGPASAMCVAQPNPSQKWEALPLGIGCVFSTQPKPSQAKTLGLLFLFVFSLNADLVSPSSSAACRSGHKGRERERERDVFFVGTERGTCGWGRFIFSFLFCDRCMRSRK